jgi:hypothetical protein
MQIQAPTLTTTRRAPVVSALAALVVAGGAYGVISIATDNDSTQSSSSPAVTNVSPNRVLDGSPILRGTAVSKAAPSSGRVLDGSPILRGSATSSKSVAPAAVLPSVVVAKQERLLGGGPILRRTANGQPHASVSHILNAPDKRVGLPGQP